MTLQEKLDQEFIKIRGELLQHGDTHLYNGVKTCFFTVLLFIATREDCREDCGMLTEAIHASVFELMKTPEQQYWYNIYVHRLLDSVQQFLEDNPKDEEEPNRDIEAPDLKTVNENYSS